MKRSNYQLVFRLRVFHSYFEQNICDCLRFDNGPITSKLANRFGLMKRDLINGFDLYINSAAAFPDMLRHISTTTGTSCFDFDIKTIEPAFYHFTELPAQWLGRLMYDSRSGSNMPAEGNIRLDPTFSTDGGMQGLGNLTVHFDDIAKSPNFNISYAARSTQWQYYVINRSDVQLDSPAISGKAGIAFDGPKSMLLDNGQQAMLFTSGNKLIPLSRVPKYKFDLVNDQGVAGQRSSRPKVIFRGLPNPGPSWTGMGTSGENTVVVSPMYVYV